MDRSQVLRAQLGVPGGADYSATKSGVERYTMGVARDLGPRGITANVVEAGLMEGGMETSPEILEALDAAGVPALPLKGPIQSFDLYGDVSLRQLTVQGREVGDFSVGVEGLIGTGDQLEALLAEGRLVVEVGEGADG